MARPTDNLDLDVRDALRLGYGCHYGDFKADHPYTAAANEARLAKMKKKPKPRPVYEVYCAGCGKKFTTANKRRRYCADTCKVRRDSAHYRQLAKTKKEEKHD
jgi:hypothetical protein